VHGIAVFKGVSAEAGAEALRGCLKPTPRCAVIPIQNHTGIVRTVGSRDGERPVISCDGVVTDEPSVMIAITVADCIPLFAVDKTGSVVGVGHCGWRGIASGIVEEFVTCVKNLVSQPAETVYLIGASIGVCCYTVREDFLGHFSDDEVESFSAVSGDKVFFDLKSLVVSRLVKSGVPTGQISIDMTCTACNNYLLSSYRADGKRSGRMLAFLMREE
jgi:YfiH family protein